MQTLSNPSTGFGPLNGYVESYLQFRHNRGCIDEKPILSTLKSLNNFLQEKGIKSVKEINQRIVLEWFGRQQNHRPQGRRQSIIVGKNWTTF